MMDPMKSCPVASSAFGSGCEQEKWAIEMAPIMMKFFMFELEVQFLNKGINLSFKFSFRGCMAITSSSAYAEVELDFWFCS